MKWSIKRWTVVLIFGGVLTILETILANEAQAVGVLYADPGWFHAFDGDGAYYHDPDGYNTDYNNGSPTNQPGGRGDKPALIDIGPCGSESECEAMAIWQTNASHWDGSAPGAPLGGVPDPPWNPTKPLLGPPAPGGAGTFMDGSTTFLRIQDPGDPAAYGWVDKGEQLSPGKPLQEGGNKRIEFKHEMSRDSEFSDRQDIIDFGVTISFRARIATAASGPLDMIYDEDAAGPFPWPEDGIGYRISGNGRGMFYVQQTSPVHGPSRLAFSLLNTNSIMESGVPTTTTGLVMNNRALNATTPGSVDTNESNAERLNIVELSDPELTEWREFWITMQQLPDPIDGNTHEVKVWSDGSLEPETFQVVLGLQNEAGTGSFLSMGLTSGSRVGAFDVDFFAYKEGVFEPALAPMGLAGDYNDDGKVDAADYVVWRKNEGTTNPLPNDNDIGGTIGADHYNLWRAHFGEMSGSGLTLRAIPEPSSALLLSLATVFICNLRRRGLRCSRGCFTIADRW